jgi:hypothetical protein
MMPILFVWPRQVRQQSHALQFTSVTASALVIQATPLNVYPQHVGPNLPAIEKAGCQPAFDAAPIR